MPDPTFEMSSVTIWPFDCYHSVMRVENDWMCCTRCPYQRKLTTDDDWPLHKLAAILPGPLVAGLALDRVMRAVREVM